MKVASKLKPVDISFREAAIHADKEKFLNV